MKSINDNATYSVGESHYTTVFPSKAAAKREMLAQTDGFEYRATEVE